MRGRPAALSRQSPAAAPAREAWPKRGAARRANRRALRGPPPCRCTMGERPAAAAPGEPGLARRDHPCARAFGRWGVPSVWAPMWTLTISKLTSSSTCRQGQDVFWLLGPVVSALFGGRWPTSRQTTPYRAPPRRRRRPSRAAKRTSRGAGSGRRGQIIGSMLVMDVDRRPGCGSCMSGWTVSPTSPTTCGARSRAQCNVREPWQ